MRPEDIILRLVKEKYGTVVAFSKICGVPQSTLATVLHRSIFRANFTTVINICQALNLDISSLAEGRVVQKIDLGGYENE